MATALRTLLMLVALAGAAAAAHAVTVAERPVTLPDPRGYCLVDPARPSDAGRWQAIAELQQPQNRLLAWFIACDEIEAWRGGPRAVARHAQVLTQEAALAMVPMSRRRVVEATAPLLAPEGLALDEAAVLSRLRERVPDLASAAAPRLTLLSRSDDALVAVLAQSLRTAEGERRIIGVVTFTALNGVPVTVSFYGLDTGPEALRAVRDDASAYVATLFAANPDVVPWSPTFRAIVIATVVAVLLAAVLVWRRRRRRATPD